jgi:tight adherence protein C
MDPVLSLFVLASFLAVAGIAFVVGQYLKTRVDLQHRLPAGATAADSSSPSPQSAIGALVSETFTEERFGIDSKLRQKLRRDLLRAGFFSPYAIRYYVFSRFCTVLVLPMAVFLLCEILAPGMQLVFLMVTVVIAAGIGVLGPDAYLSRRQNGLIQEYRLIFPDLLDLLNVCISAGLSVEASFDRVREHIAKRSRTLGRNIELMGAEMRAGRSTIEALNSFADRLALDEAASFVAVLRHSVELGGDIAASLRVFSEDMRVKRMLLAEKKANELPVKMVMPLALGIFPVILTMVLLPVLVKLMQVLK